MGEGLRVVGLSVAYGAVRALSDVDLDVAPGEIVAVVGRSGSGKTSLLRAVAGMVTPTAGTVAFGGAEITRSKPHKREFGFVVTAPHLFDRYTVGGNVSYGLGSWPRADRQGRVREVLDLFDVADLADRHVSDLTNAQARRVSLARSLAPRPRLMLLDEPFGEMDRRDRAELSQQMIDTLRDEGIPTLYVTHSIDEAFDAADRLVVLDGGLVAQDGPVPLVRHRPATRTVAEHMGFGPFLAGHARDGVVTTVLGSVPSQGRTGDVLVGIGIGGLRPDPVGVEVLVSGQRVMSGFVDVVVQLPDGQTAHVRAGDTSGVHEVAVALDPQGCVVLPTP